jgi:uncharacterized protein YcfJ
MRNFKMFLLVPAAILAVACGRDDSSKKVDDALNADLTLAAQARPYMAMDSISAMERAYAAQGLAPVGYAPNGYAPVYSQPVQERVVYRDRPVYRSSGTRSSGTTTARTTTRVKHTKRDAAIGGVAGAAIGAVTSRDKLKGAVIGGVAGAILGGVIGNNVDITKR